MAAINEETGELQYVGIRFCQNCNNMLYPKEDKRRLQLRYACRNCDYDVVATDSPCVYVNRVTHATNELAHIVGDVTSDPTLSRTKDRQCPKCSNHEAVFFQTQINRSQADMRLFYVCCNKECLHRWNEV